MRRGAWSVERGADSVKRNRLIAFMIVMDFSPLQAIIRLKPVYIKLRVRYAARNYR